MKRSLTCLLIIALTTFVFQRCKKESNVQQPSQSQVEFSFSSIQLKSTEGQGLAFVVLTIEDAKGNVIKSSEKLEIYSMNGNYISKPLSLKTGDYNLSRFMVLDASNNVVYAAPTQGSAKAYLVKKPLPLSFTIQKDNVTKVSPEVISTVDCRPEDFGYATFSFEIAKTFDFLVGAFVYNDVSKNFDLTTASINIYSDTNLVYSGKLLANTTATLSNYDALGITNKITLPEKYNNYTIIISKSLYKDYNKAFTKEELRLQYRKEDKGPLVVVLEKLPVQIPVLTTSSVGAITKTSAASGGNITSDGGAAVTLRGVCWSTSVNPSITNSTTSNGSGTGAFTSSITGLIANTQYYVRAYATNSVGTAYGNEFSFTTLPSAIPGLVAYYPFNGNVNDESGNGNNGTINGATLTTDRFGNSNSAYAFNGIDNYIKVQNPLVLKNSNYTISLWIKVLQLPISSYCNYIMELGNGNYGVQGHSISINNSYPMSSPTSGWSVNCPNTDATRVNFQTGTLPYSGVWYHIVLVRNDNSVDYYENGTMIKQLLTNGTLPNYPNPLDLYIGARAQLLPDFFFNGIIDDIRIYNRSLSSSELTELQNL